MKDICKSKVMAADPQCFEEGKASILIVYVDDIIVTEISGSK